MSMGINGDINASGDYVGGFAGIINKTLTLQSIFTSVDINAKNYVGGIVGAINNNVTFIDIESTGNITAQDYVGGIVGAAKNQKSMILSPLTLKNVVNYSSIEARSYVGGILGSGFINIGSMASGKVINSGELRATDSYLGGIIGEITGMTSSGTLSIINNGELYGNKYVGGIIGSVNCENINIVGQYSVYSNKISGAQYVGGMIGGSNSETTPTINVVNNINISTIIYFDFDNGYSEGHGDDANVNKLFASNVKTSQIAGPNGTLKTGGWYGEEIGETSITVEFEDVKWYGMTISSGISSSNNESKNLYAQNSSSNNVMMGYYGNMPNMYYHQSPTVSNIEYFISKNNVYKKNDFWNIPVGLFSGYQFNGNIGDNPRIIIDTNSYICDLKGNKTIYIDSFVKTFYEYYNIVNVNLIGILILEFNQQFRNTTIYPKYYGITLNDIAQINISRSYIVVEEEKDDGDNVCNLSKVCEIKGRKRIELLFLGGYIKYDYSGVTIEATINSLLYYFRTLTLSEDETFELYIDILNSQQ